MATPAITVAPGTIVPSSERKAWKDPYGDLPAIVDSAKAELLAGNLENAWTAYQIAMEHWLRRTWIEKSGKVNSPITDRNALLLKLQSSLAIDEWTCRAIKMTLYRPLPVERQHVDVMAAVVTALTCEHGRSLPR